MHFETITYRIDKFLYCTLFEILVQVQKVVQSSQRSKWKVFKSCSV